MPSETAKKQAMSDLDVAGYPGKWKAAQELAEKNERTDDNRLLPYWERVRILFLELGGEYLKRQHRCGQCGYIYKAQETCPNGCFYKRGGPQ